MDLDWWYLKHEERRDRSYGGWVWVFARGME